MLLVELFKQTFPWEETEAGGHYVFEVPDVHDENKYEVTFNDFHTSTMLRMIKKAKHNIPQDVQEELSKLEVIPEVEFKNDYGYEISGTGNAYAVFGTVVEIIEDYMRKHNAPYLNFAAKEGSRQKLYQRMLKYFGKTYYSFDMNGENYIIKW